MLWFKRALSAVLAVALAAATLLFVLENQHSVALNYLGFSTPELPVSLLVVAAFVVGGLLGVLLGAVRVSRLKYRLKVLEISRVRSGGEFKRVRKGAADESSELKETASHY